MASAFSHAAVTLGIGACFYRPEIPKRVWVVGAICSTLPDLDVLGFGLGVHYGDFLGHRGFTHSLLFAALLALYLAMRMDRTGPIIGRSRLWLYLFLATASHGLIDAMTNGGLGVAFFSPFDMTRYFLPWTPIEVSPISIRRFFTARGLSIAMNEFVWVWIPSGILATLALALRRRETVRAKAQSAS